MRWGKAKTKIWEAFRWYFQQLGESISRCTPKLKNFTETFRILMAGSNINLGSIMITIDILSQKGDLLDTLALQLLDLLQYGLNIPTSLPAPNKGHNAKRAHVITSSHDGQERRNRRKVLSYWCDVCVGFFDAKLHVHFVCFEIFLNCGLNQFWKITIRVRPAYDVDSLFEHLVF